MIILDIGCGRKKIAGAVGIDFSSMSDADVVINLNHERLPFDESSVDFIYSSHMLEHHSLDGFSHLMKEIYRALKLGAQFKIIVPYFTTIVNLANLSNNSIGSMSIRSGFSLLVPNLMRFRSTKLGTVLSAQR